MNGDNVGRTLAEQPLVAALPFEKGGADDHSHAAAGEAERVVNECLSEGERWVRADPIRDLGFIGRPAQEIANADRLLIDVSDPVTVERQAHDAGLELVVVSRPKGDLLERMKSEMRRTAPEGKPFWPTATKRYCTAEAKRDQLVKVHRRLGGVVIAAQGIRAEESPRRAKAQVVTVERRATSKRIRDLSPAEALAERKPEERLVLNWLPIFGVLIADVWAACDTSVFELEQRRALYRAYRETGDAALLAAALDGWTAHAAYVFGSSRLSCALCVLASRQDLETGAIHNPALFAELLAMERESGFSFQPNLRLAGLTAR